jgi:UDP-N-acetylglucosamine--N-acetylmuramyl-(pentapeptide) pyrophosphoryl-undecaprenol N-acetylglucosamine transferase
LFAKSAKVIASGFERLDKIPSSAKARWKLVGNPVRPSILGVRDLPYPALEDTRKINLLVTGGSQGARMFGEIIPEAISQLPEQLRTRLHVVQQVRDEQIETVRAIYSENRVSCELQSFFSDMDRRLSQAHLVIARSGAGTVTELCVAGRPAILIPLGIAMDDHQRANAEAMEAAGGARVVLEKDFNPNALAALLLELFQDTSAMTLSAESAKKLGPLKASSDLADLAIAASQ